MPPRNALDNVIFVSSVDPLTQKIAETSNRPGENSFFQNMTVCAGGERTVWMSHDNRYIEIDHGGGTSSAAPVVTGISVLIQEIYPHFNAKLLKVAILASAKRDFSWYDPAIYGQGIVDAPAALELAHLLDESVRSGEINPEWTFEKIFEQTRIKYPNLQL